jgi:hypothetical protein
VRRSIDLMLLLCGLSAAAAHAQTVMPLPAVAFPGSFWIATGDAGPAEPHNMLGQAVLEQGLTVWQDGAWFLIPYVGVSMTADSQGYDWNNKHPTTVAIKLQRRTANGVIFGGGGMMFERDPATGRDRHLTASITYWSGWQGSSRANAGGLPLEFPGSINATAGRLTGRDPENWMSSVSLQQGIVASRWHGLALVPYGGSRATFDTKRRVWENRVTSDAGVKLTRALTGGVVEVGVAQRHQYGMLTHESSATTVGFINLWIGWNPSATSHP